MVNKLINQNVNHKVSQSSEPIINDVIGDYGSYPLRQPVINLHNQRLNTKNVDIGGQGIHKNFPSPAEGMASSIPGFSKIGTESSHLENSFQTSNGLPLPPPRVGQNYSQPISTSYGYGTPSYGYGTGGYISPYRPMYNSYNYSQYSPYSSYSRPYRPSPYNSLQQGSSFFEEAHENTREAFAGIESIVSAFGSINMMIESTYYALQSSFNAVLSVIDNFSRLKNHFSQILSAFTIIRTLQWMLRKILYLIGFYKHDPTSEAAWKNASKIFDDSKTSKSSRSSWPMIAFLMAVYAGPFIMWKFLASILKSNLPNDSEWMKPKENHYYANAIYNYTAQNPDELSLNIGDYLILAPKEMQTDKSWPLAYNGKTTGIIPVNYIKIGYNKSKSTLAPVHEPEEKIQL